MRPVEIVDYDPSWPALFAAERDGLRALLGDLLDDVHPIGSTSVPGLAAKPKIDIDAVLRSDDLVPEAIARGSQATGRWGYHGDPLLATAYGLYAQPPCSCGTAVSESLEAPGNARRIEKARCFSRVTGCAPSRDRG